MAERVLMIEDDEPLAAMLSEYLGSYGFAVTARATATDGLQLLRHGRFDALVPMSCCQTWMALKCVAASVPSPTSRF